MQYWIYELKQTGVVWGAWQVRLAGMVVGLTTTRVRKWRRKRAKLRARCSLMERSSSVKNDDDVVVQPQSKSTLWVSLGRGIRSMFLVWMSRCYFVITFDYLLEYQSLLRRRHEECYFASPYRIHTSTQRCRGRPNGCAEMAPIPPPTKVAD